MTYYIYANKRYETATDVEAAVTAMKQALDTQPTLYCHIKQLSGDAESGWIIPSYTLTDDQILNLSDTAYYSVYSQYSGENFMGITGQEALVKVEEYKKVYGARLRVNELHTVDAPTNEDMSGYV